MEIQSNNETTTAYTTEFQLFYSSLNETKLFIFMTFMKRTKFKYSGRKSLLMSNKYNFLEARKYIFYNYIIVMQLHIARAYTLWLLVLF